MNNNVIETPNGRLIKAWTKGVPFADNSLAQVMNTASMPFLHKHVAVMPDVHHGLGSTVGTVFATKGAIIPAAVGVDIGCGMIAQRTTLTASDLPDSLTGLRSKLEELIPHGRTDNGGVNDKGAHHSSDRDFGEHGNAVQFMLERLHYEVFDRSEGLQKQWNEDRVLSHVGTLGSGNHFVEVCLDENDTVWIMLHSGSRGIGNRIGQHYIELAKGDMRRYFINLPDQDLAYLPEGSKHFYDYVAAVNWAQKYAALNRNLMMSAAITALQSVVRKPFTCDCSAINCHHNYISKEAHFGENVWVTRKGAVRARAGELGIIPGSMGARSFIVEGKGNPESFCSCSHGAGRVMSRMAAKKAFTLDDHIQATAGVECRKDIDVIDETPKAYKDIDAVMAAQSDLVEIKHTLRQVVCVKG